MRWTMILGQSSENLNFNLPYTYLAQTLQVIGFLGAYSLGFYWLKLDDFSEGSFL